MRYLFYLDKDYPPSHSFVDGFIVEKAKLDEVEIICHAGRHQSPTSYRGVKIIRALPGRKGVSYLHSVMLFFVFSLFRSRYEKIIIRNDPVFLILMRLFLRRSEELIYQSSFPHEDATKNLIKNFVGRFLVKCAVKLSHQVLLVSEGAKSRVKDYDPRAVCKVIPLLGDNDWIGRACVKRKLETAHICYIGTLAEIRKLEQVFYPIVKAVRDGAKVKVHIYGGSKKEYDRIIAAIEKKEVGESALIRSTLIYHGSVQRDEIPEAIRHCQFGLSIIPPLDIYLESSPTKLAEYMSLGIIPVVNLEIPSQKKIHTSSDSCIGVLWSEESIYEATFLASNMSDFELRSRSQEGLDFCRAEFNYISYLDVI